MPEYICEHCGKDFKQRSHYIAHEQRKFPCENHMDKIKTLVDKLVDEKIKEITTPPKKKILIRKVKTIDLPNDIIITKPILKWVGGKSQILDKLFVEFPTTMNNYYEPFLGGGSVLLALLTYAKHGLVTINGTVHAFDLNEPLIHLYRNIQSNPSGLYAKVVEFIEEFDMCGTGEINRSPSSIEEAKVNRENYYYWIRKEYNKLSASEKNSINGSAMLLFLNKTCFRGVFRVGPNGFNVPYGHYNNPEIINKQHLDTIHNLIQGVVFECGDFSKSLASLSPGDFVYADPPYAPEAANSFVGYTENGFGIDKHMELFNKLKDMKVKFLLSNSDVELVRNNFPDGKFTTKSVLCKRSINSKNPESKTKEVIIKNY